MKNRPKLVNGAPLLWRKCSDLPDAVFLASVAWAGFVRGTRTANRWDVEYLLGPDPAALLVPTAPPPPGVPPNLVLAKFRRLAGPLRGFGRGLVEGCPCGCRGDWRVTPAGINVLRDSGLPLPLRFDRYP